MKKTILQPYIIEIYALAVCFITLICFMISLAIGAYSFLIIIKPEFTLNSNTYSQYQTNDLYWAKNLDDSRFETKESKQKERPDEAELTAERKEAFSQILMVEQHEGWQTLVKTVIILIIGAIIFFIHWKLAKRVRTAVISEICDPHDGQLETKIVTS